MRGKVKDCATIADMFPINFFIILAVAAIAFVIQFIINGPLFAKFYMKLAGKTEALAPASNLPLKLLLNFIVTIFTVYGVAVAYLFTSTSIGHSVLHGIFSGVFIWLTFLVPASAIDVIWNGKKVPVWLFEVIASFVVLGAMGLFVALLG